MFELLVVVIIIAVAMIIRYRKKLATATDGNALPPTTSWRTVASSNQVWIKRSLAIGVVAALFLFWDKIKVPVAEWLEDSVIGSRFNLEPGFVENWLWVPVTVLIAYTLFRMFRTGRGAAGANKSGTGVKDFFNGTVDVIVVTIFLGVIAAGLLLAGGIVVKVAGIDKAVVDVAESMMGNVKVKCVDQKILSKIAISPGGRDIVICPDQRAIYLYPAHNHRLQVEVSPVFAYGHLLENRNLRDFIEVNPPGTFLESISTSWRIVIKPAEFHKSGLNHLTLFVRAVER
jgi:hypothetical protein